jgi:hypothetical protein
MLGKIKSLYALGMSFFKTKSKIKHNSELRLNQKSDIYRWKHNSELFQDWDERTLILGSYISMKSNVIEFGAGNMVLKTLNFKSYTPTDIVKRNQEMLVCNLNEPIALDLSVYDTAAFSGVLEYVYDIENVFKQLSQHIDQVVLSYCCSDIVMASRDKNGWLSDFTKNELEGIFEKYDYKVVDYSQWRNQSLYNLKKNG